MLFCAVFIHFSVSFFGIRIPPSNRRRDATHNLVAYFARAKPKLKEREKFDPEVPLKFLLETCRIVFWLSCWSFAVNCRENLVQFARKANWNYCDQRKAILSSIPINVMQRRFVKIDRWTDTLEIRNDHWLLQLLVAPKGAFGFGGKLAQWIYLLLVYLVTALVPSLTACFANSPGRSSLMAVWISRELMVDFLL